MTTARHAAWTTAMGAALWVVACGDVVAQPIGGAPGDGGGGSSGGGGDGGGPDGAGDALSQGDSPFSGDAADFCSGTGPIPIGTNECSGDVARLFRFAACACDSLAVSGVLTTDSFDSSADGGGGSSASIAANGQVATNAQTSVQGSVWAGGQGLPPGTPAVALGAPVSATSHIDLDVQSGGDVQTNGTVLVGRDVYADGDVIVQSGSLSVVQTVHVPAGDSATGVTSGGGVVDGPVLIAPPCDCTKALDIAGIVSAKKASNDDATAGLSATSLDNPTTPVNLPCGLFYVDGIHGTSAVEIDVTGRAALFVGGDVDAEGGLTITTSGGELDLFVAGDVTLKGTTLIGAKNAPAKTRLYVGGTALTLVDTAVLGANVYAPGADVQVASDFEMWGAFFAKSLEFSGFFKIHYDTQILDTPGCTPPGSGCTTCDQCAGATPACVAGTCTACKSDADCCAPLECIEGTGYCQLPIQ